MKKNVFSEELPLNNTSSNVPDSLQMNRIWYVFKTDALDFRSYFNTLRNLENKICMLMENRYSIFKCSQEQSRMLKIAVTRF